jgi:hypothetical protein
MFPQLQYDRRKAEFCEVRIKNSECWCMTALDTVLPNVSVLLNKLVTTDAASAMLGGKVGLVRFFKS